MTHYETLNVLETATQDEIKASYRRLAMKYHPDKNPGNKEAEEKFKDINEAYMVLSEPSKRATYDQSRKFVYTGKSRNEHRHSDYEWKNYNEQEDDWFSFFRENQKTRYSESRPKSNNITTVSITLKFWEAVFGCTKKVKVPAKVLPGNIQANITFEPGIENGATLQVTIKNKVFHIKVIVKEDKTFKRNGLDLHTTFDVPLTTALLGGSIIFPHWTKEVEITIPPETIQGQKFRLKQMGVLKNSLAGDLYFSINIKAPQKLTKRQKELMEEFKKLEKTKESESYKNLKKLWQNTQN